MRHGTLRWARPRRGLWRARACAAALVLVAVLGWQAAPAAAGRAHSGRREPTIHLKRLGTSYTPVYTDGARWAVYEPTAGVTRIMDTLTGNTTTRPDPEGCAGGLVAIGGGEMLYACSDPECPEQAQSCGFPPYGPLELPKTDFESRRYVVEDIHSGVQHVVPGTSRIPVGDWETHFHLSAIGSQWAAGREEREAQEPHNNGGQGLFVNWHTGRVLYEGRKPAHSGQGIGEEPSSAKAAVENLNAVRLMRRVCAPLMRPLNGEEQASSYYSPFVYDPPFAIVGPSGLPSGGFSTAPAVPFQLRRCGSTRRVLLPTGYESGYDVHSAQLADDILSWVGGGSEEETGYVTLLHVRGRSWHGVYYEMAGLPTPVQGGAYSAVTVQHTSRIVFADIQEGTSLEVANHTRVYYARLPWAHG